MRSGRPVRGLVSFYLDTGPSGNFDRKNATQRMGPTMNMLWTYFPTTVAVVYGTLWMIVDSEMKKREKFRQLSQKKGCKGASSLCLDYHYFWIPCSVIQAVRYQQWPVACSSIGYTLALIAIPNIQNYAFKWVVFSGGHFEWGAAYSWQSGQLDPYWAKVLLALLALNLLCSLCLFPFTRSRAFVASEPGGIMTIAELVWDKVPADFGLEASHETAPVTKIASILWDQRFCVVEENQSMRLEVLRGSTSPPQSPVSTSITPPPFQGRNRCFREICQKSRAYWNLFLLKTKPYVRKVSIWMNGSPYPFLLTPLALTLWIIFLSLILTANAYIVHNMTRPQQLADQNYVLPFNPSLYIVVGVSIQSIFQVLDQNLRSLTPLSALRQGFQPPFALFTDFSSPRPILEVFLALAHGYTLLATVMLTSFLAALYTVLLGALQVSASFYGATTFASDLACAIATLALNAWFLITSVAVGWNYCGWRYRGDIGGRRFLTRGPATIGAMMPFLLSSGKLREDVAVVRRIDGRENKTRWLEEQGRRYGFGRFRDSEGREHVGVERNETVIGGRTHVWT
ncbi:MAG: hypothetical protein Q9214_003116 [Letrouitia sp. 1 TL-2023]